MTDAPERPATRGQEQSGRFAPGQSGNPAGRPKGTRHQALVALDAIGAEGAERVLRRVMAMADNGDLKACELILTRLWPPRRSRPVLLELPSMHTAADLIPALGALIAALGSGQISPEEANSVASVLEVHRKAIETIELDTRIAALEGRVTAAS